MWRKNRAWNPAKEKGIGKKLAETRRKGGMDTDANKIGKTRSHRELF